MTDKKLKHIPNGASIIGEIKEKKEFRDYIPPLTDFESSELQSNIREYGIREPLVVWDNGKEKVLLDGHNRLRIWKELKKEAEQNKTPFSVALPIDIITDIEHDSDAKIWMLYNQLGRRNLTAYSRCELAFQLEDEFKAIAKERKKRTKYKDRDDVLAAAWYDLLPAHLTPEDCSEDEKTQFQEQLTLTVDEALAAITGIPKRTLQRAKRVKEFVYQHKRGGGFDKYIESNADEQEKISYNGYPSDWYRKEFPDSDRILKGLWSGEISIASAENQILAHERKIDAEDMLTIEVDLLKELPEMLHTTFQDAQRKIKEGSVDAVISDIPYKKSWAKNYDALFTFCEHVLRKDGIMLIMCGTLNIPQIFPVLHNHPRLVYGMTLCWTRPEDAACGGGEIKKLNMESGWKPILLYQKDSQFISATKRLSNVIRCGKKPDAKKANKNVQDIETFLKLIEDYTLPGQTICDPCGGEATTACASIRLNRKPIYIECDQTSFNHGQKNIALEFDNKKKELSMLDKKK